MFVIVDARGLSAVCDCGISRTCSPFQIDNLRIHSLMFYFKVFIHIIIRNEWYGIVNGQNPSIFTKLLSLFVFEKWLSIYYSLIVYI